MHQDYSPNTGNRKSILFISTVNALPARDGVTIPIAGYLHEFTKDYNVDFLRLCRPASNDTGEPETRRSVREYASIAIKRPSKLVAAFHELAGKRPYYGSFRAAENLPEWARQTEYDIVWLATPQAIGAWNLERWSSIIQHNISIAGISDLHSLVLKNQMLTASVSSSLRYRLTNCVVSPLRCRQLARSEVKLLTAFNKVLIQTSKELDWAEKIGGKQFTVERFLVAPNGVDKNLFSIPLSRKSKSILFIGNLSGVYRERLEWFIKNAWHSIHKRDSDITFTVVGVGAPNQTKMLMKECGIHHIEFVEDLCDVYSDQAILIAPIFKGYGLINKVVEAMASGTLVIGDPTAFNGLDFYTPGVHGVTASTGKEFTDAIIAAFRESETTYQIRHNARHIISENFSWPSRFRNVIESL